MSRNDAEPAIEPALSVAKLREIGLFGGLDDAVLEHFATTLPRLTLQPGDIVFREGDSGREIFVLLEGEMEVRKRSRDGHEVRLAVLGPGDWFGEMSLLDVQPRSASVRALAPSQLLVFRAQDLDALYRRDLKAYALIVMNIAREISRRLRIADGILAGVVASVLGKQDIFRSA